MFGLGYTPIWSRSCSGGRRCTTWSSSGCQAQLTPSALASGHLSGLLLLLPRSSRSCCWPLSGPSPRASAAGTGSLSCLAPLEPATGRRGRRTAACRRDGTSLVTKIGIGYNLSQVDDVPLNQPKVSRADAVGVLGRLSAQPGAAAAGHHSDMPLSATSPTYCCQQGSRHRKGLPTTGRQCTCPI